MREGAEYKGSDVHNMGASDFKIRKNGSVYVNSVRFKGKPGLIKFYAPWCGYCKKIVPEVKRLATKLKPYDVNVGSVNCEDREKDNHTLSENVGIEGYPSLYVVKKSGRLVEYNGSYDAKSMIRGIEEHV
jgi:thiol-disulfide isomerase/thioredoxin